MDNLSSHRRASVQVLIEAAGEILRFLPSYSPDFNPIEKAFSRLKAMLRKSNGLYCHWPVEHDWQTRRYLPALRVRQLLQIMRVRTRMIENRSRSAYPLYRIETRHSPIGHS